MPLLHTLKRFVVAGSDRGVFTNFPLDVAAAVPVGDGVWPVTVAYRERTDSLACTVRLEPREPSQNMPDVFLRRPVWADSVTVTDQHGEVLATAVQNGYVRLAGRVGRIGDTFSSASSTTDTVTPTS